jgi:hypothetical protein
VTTVPDGMTPHRCADALCLDSRTKTDGPADYDAVHKIQAGYKIMPLSQWGGEPKPPAVNIDPDIDMKTPPKKQVDTMPADKHFAYAAELLKLTRPISPISRSSHG